MKRCACWSVVSANGHSVARERAGDSAGALEDYGKAVELDPDFAEAYANRARLRWQQGDLVLWDNRCSVHRALPHENMGVHRRVLHRTVVKGTVPY